MDMLGSTEVNGSYPRYKLPQLEQGMTVLQLWKSSVKFQSSDPVSP